jgi:hypothetical protein
MPTTPAPSPGPGETSLIGRGVALLTPLFALLAGGIAGEASHLVPGLKLDKSQLVAFMVVVATSALTSAWKWLDGWQQHELLVAQKVVAPYVPKRKRSAPQTAAETTR